MIEIVGLIIMGAVAIFWVYAYFENGRRENENHHQLEMLKLEIQKQELLVQITKAKNEK